MTLATARHDSLHSPPRWNRSPSDALQALKHSTATMRYSRAGRECSFGMMARARCILLVLLLMLLPALAQASVQVQISGIDKLLAAAVRANLALTPYADRAVSEPQMRRLYASVPGEVRKALQPYGYFAARLEHGAYRRTGGKPDAGDWIVTLRIAAGAPVRVTAVHLDMPADALQLPAVRRSVRAFAPKAGAILDQALYSRSKQAVMAALQADGFLDAKATQHEIAVNTATHSAVITLAWAPGPRYRLGAVTFSGSQFEPGFLQRYVPWRSGEFYSQDALLQLQQHLSGADYFSMVEVNPEPQRARDLVVPVAVTVAPAKRTVYTAGLLYGTDTGAGIEGGVRRRWLNRYGHKASFDTLLAQRLKTTALTYTIPRPGQDNKAFNFGANWLDSSTATSRSRTLGLVANESREWRGFSSSFGLNALSGDYVVGGENGNSTLLYAEASLAKKHGANPVYVRNGWAVSAIGRAGGPLSTTAFTQLTLDGTWIHSLAPRDRIILRGDAGATWVQDFNSLPPQLRFFAGGDRSIRGYGYQTVGPRNAQGLVIGGRNLLVASATYEHYFLPKWGVALFADGGDAFNGSAFQMHQAIGFGLRWISPVGPVRVDFGFPIGDRYAHGLSLHISIGPDL